MNNIMGLKLFVRHSAGNDATSPRIVSRLSAKVQLFTLLSGWSIDTSIWTPHRRTSQTIMNIFMPEPNINSGHPKTWIKTIRILCFQLWNTSWKVRRQGDCVPASLFPHLHKIYASDPRFRLAYFFRYTASSTQRLYPSDQSHMILISRSWNQNLHKANTAVWPSLKCFRRKHPHHQSWLYQLKRWSKIGLKPQFASKSWFSFCR